MPPYVELHCHSNFSLLDGASHPEDLVAQAAHLGMDALALTDHDAVYAAPRFVRAAKAHGVRPILGAELTLEDGHHLTLLVEDEAGWHNLCWLITRARRDAPKSEAALPRAALEGHTSGLIALSGCRQGMVAAALRRKDRDAALATGRRYRDLFGPGNFWVELQRHLLPSDDALVRDLVALARHLRLGIVTTNNVHYATRDGHRLQDVLVCIRHLTTLDESEHLRRPNSEYYLKSAERMAHLFPDQPEGLANTRRIAERCQFELRYGIQNLPRFSTPAGQDPPAYLRHLCDEALPRRYADPATNVCQQLDHELGVIERAGLSNYFLIVWDVVRFARERGILCQGRGSAANSLVAYLLGVTPIDPLAHDLVFERFLSDERALTPDIDIDFQADRREEVIQYLYERYGHEHTAMACTFVTFRARSAIRDVGRALGFPASVLDQAAKTVDYRDMDGEGVVSSPGFQAVFGDQLGALPWRQLIDLTAQIRGFPRHLGIHNGGMVITGGALAERVPTEPATMPDRLVVQWDKDALEDVGLVKLDILGLRMLSAIAEAVEIIEEMTSQRPDLDALAFDDPAVYDLIARADTVGVFQVESRAQATVLPRLRPRRFEDLIISISLIRPGPIQGNMVHPYLRRRLGEEPVTYDHPLLEAALAETLGVILFQEQVLKVARDLGGLTPGQGEQLRRALGAKHAGEAIECLHDVFIAGAQSKGVSEEVAEAIFERLRAFGGYSFAKSHAAAFAVLVYQSAWLKVYHPAAFFCALLNQQPMGFWSPAVLTGDARRHGVRTLSVDVNRSSARCTVERGDIRLGSEYVDKIGEVSAARIEATRGAKPYVDLADFCCRTRLPRRLVENLIMVGAMDGWGIQRRKLLWELGKLSYREEELDLMFPADDVALPHLTDSEKVGLEYSLVGLSTGDHVMAIYRPWLEERGVLSSEEFKGSNTGEKVSVAGMVMVHQAPPTAKGFHFITLEDEEGLVDVVVRPDIYARDRQVFRGTRSLIVEGVVQRRGSVVNLLALRAAQLP